MDGVFGSLERLPPAMWSSELFLQAHYSQLSLLKGKKREDLSLGRIEEKGGVLRGRREKGRGGVTVPRVSLIFLP